MWMEVLVRSLPRELQEGKFNTASLSWDLKNPTLWTVLIATLFSKTTEYGADQTMVQRYLTTRDVKTASRGVWMNAALTVPATLDILYHRYLPVCLLQN